MGIVIEEKGIHNSYIIKDVGVICKRFPRISRKSLLVENTITETIYFRVIRGTPVFFYLSNLENSLNTVVNRLVELY